MKQSSIALTKIELDYMCNYDTTVWLKRLFLHLYVRTQANEVVKSRYSIAAIAYTNDLNIMIELNTLTYDITKLEALLYNKK